MDKDANGAVVRVVKSSNFTIISNGILKNKQISYKAKGLMCVCLSLPDGWAFSIPGLSSLSTDGRVSIEGAIKELKKFGYLVVTKERTEKGNFRFIYTFYENPLNEGVLSDVENPPREIHCGKSTAENRHLLNTNNENTNNQELNNQDFENVNVFSPLDLFNLYKSSCLGFPQPRELTDGRRQKATKRLKEHPDRVFWEKVFEKANESDFCKKNSFFCFDWILENDRNALKVYEGNYANDKFAKNNSKVVNIIPSNSDKYASYKQQQGV